MSLFLPLGVGVLTNLWMRVYAQMHCMRMFSVWSWALRLKIYIKLFLFCAEKIAYVFPQRLHISTIYLCLTLSVCHGIGIDVVVVIDILLSLSCARTGLETAEFSSARADLFIHHCRSYWSFLFNFCSSFYIFRYLHASDAMQCFDSFPLVFCLNIKYELL